MAKKLTPDEKVLLFLNAHPWFWYTLAEITHGKGINLSRSTIKRALQRMYHRGLIWWEGGEYTVADRSVPRLTKGS